MSEGRHVLGVNLKTKLITSFIVLSLPAMGFHLFASYFIATNLESWLKGQQESVIQSAQNVSETYHQNLAQNHGASAFALVKLYN